MRLSSDHTAAGMLFVAIGVLASQAPVQSDTWWLLRAGADIWGSWQVPLADNYSYTAAGRYWWNHEWLSEVLFYGLFRLGGLPLLTACCAGAVLATWATVWRTCRARFELLFVVTGLCLVVAAQSWAIRPQVLSALLFAVVMRLAIDDRKAIWIPAVVVVWVNLHGAAVSSLVLVAGAAAGAAVWQRRIPWRLTAILAASAIAIGASPVGFRMFAEIAASMERSRLNALIEWLPPAFTPGLVPFWILVVALPVATVALWRKWDERTARLLGIAIACLPLALRSTRNVGLFLIAAVPAFTSLLAPLIPAARPPKGERPELNAAVMTIVVAAGLIIAVTVWRHPPARLGWRPIAPEAVKAIESCPGPLYNTYGDGGVLIWWTPQQRVFIDNRQDPYPTDLLSLNRTMETTGAYAEAFTQYKIQCVALPPQSAIARRLVADPQWSVTYQDPQWLVAIRLPRPQ
jgi:hypothetical protein